MGRKPAIRIRICLGPNCHFIGKENDGFEYKDNHWSCNRCGSLYSEIICIINPNHITIYSSLNDGQISRLTDSLYEILK